MSQETVKEKIDEQKPRKESIPDIYVNIVEVFTRIYDVQINFGIKSSPGDELEDLVVIRMSPQHALALSQVLDRSMKAYQEKVGKMNLPENLVQLRVRDDSDEIKAES